MTQREKIEAESFNSTYAEFIKEQDLIKKFNLFLKLHCKDDYAHLIDNDDNAGEFMRQAISTQIETLITEGKIEEHELIYSHAPDYESEWMAERWNELQASLKGKEV